VVTLPKRPAPDGAPSRLVPSISFLAVLVLKDQPGDDRMAVDDDERIDASLPNPLVASAVSRVADRQAVPALESDRRPW
jgi:hypothetical protein